MVFTLQDTVQQTIITSMEANWRENRRSWAAVPTYTLRDDETFFWFATGLPRAWLNAIMFARLTKE